MTWVEQGNDAWAKGDDKEAERAFREAVVANEEDAEYFLGDILQQTGRSEEGERYLQMALDAGDPDAHVPLGHAIADQGRPEEAAKHFRAAVEVGHTDALVDLGVLQIDDLKDAAAGEETLREAIAHGVEDAPLALAALYVEQERDEEAEAILRTATDQGSLDAQVDLANLLSEYEGGEEEAEALYRDAIERGDEDAENNLGVLLRDLGRIGEAIDILKVAADRGDELAAQNLADIRAEMN